MGPRHHVNYSDEDGKPIIRRSSRQLARGKRRVYTNGIPRYERDSSPSTLELFQKATNRKPRLFTERRQAKLAEFMRNFDQHERRYGKFGSAHWIDAVIRFLGEKGRSALLRNDVTYWIQTSSFFTKYQKRVRFLKSPAKAGKRRSPQSFCDTSSPSGSGSSQSSVSEDDSSADAQSVDDFEGFEVVEVVPSPSNGLPTQRPLMSAASISGRKPLSAIQSQATVAIPGPASAFAKIEIGNPAADSSCSIGAAAAVPAPQPVPVPSNNNVPQLVTSTQGSLQPPQSQQSQSAPAVLPQMMITMEGLPPQTFTPATMSFQVPLRGTALPDMGQPQQPALLQPGESAGWTLFLTSDGKIVADPSVITVTPDGVIQSKPSAEGANATASTAATLTSSTGESSKVFYLNLTTDSLNEVVQTCTQPGTATASVVSQLQTPGVSTQELLTYYSDTIVQMIGELRKTGSTIANTDGCYHAASLLNLCLRNNL